MVVSYIIYNTMNCLFYKFFFSISGKSLWELILEQFDDLLVKILLLAAIISFVSIAVLLDLFLFRHQSDQLDFTRR